MTAIRVRKWLLWGALAATLGSAILAPSVPPTVIFSLALTGRCSAAMTGAGTDAVAAAAAARMESSINRRRVMFDISQVHFVAAG